jgi:hypothetical protein
MLIIIYIIRSINELKSDKKKIQVIICLVFFIRHTSRLLFVKVSSCHPLVFHLITGKDREEERC